MSNSILTIFLLLPTKMGRYFILFVITLIYIIKPTSAKFNIDYLYSTNHALKMLTVPIPQNKIPSDALLISNKNGRQFSCTLPMINLNEDRGTLIDPSNDIIKQLRSKIIIHLQDISADQNNLEYDLSIFNPPSTALETTNSQTDQQENKNSKFSNNQLSIKATQPKKSSTFPRQDCFYHSTAEWWSYELCINQHIKQFHLADGKPNQISLIGKFEKDFDWDKTPSDDDKEHFSDYENFGKNNGHVQYYSDGDICDLTGEPRTAKLVHVCDNLSTIRTKLISIQEPSTCKYEIVLHSQAMCKHPEFIPKAMYSSSGRTIKNEKDQTFLSIECSKVVTCEEFEEWEKLNIEAEKEQKIKNDGLMAQLIKNAKDKAMKIHDKNVQNDEPKIDSLKDVFRHVGTAITNKGLEAMKDFLKDKFEGVDEIYVNGEEIKQEPKQGSLDSDSSISDQNKPSNSEPIKTSFTDNTGKTLEIEENSEVSEQLSSLKKSIIDELKQNGQLPDNGNEVRIQFVNIGADDDDEGAITPNGKNIKMDNLKIPKLSPENIKRIKEALVMSMSKETTEKGDLAQNEYDDLSRNYHEDEELKIEL